MTGSTLVFPRWITATAGLVLLAAAGNFGCMATEPRGTNRTDSHIATLAATAWTQSSIERRAGALQAYEQAKRQLDAALADPTWTAAIEQTGDPSALPPAVILDVDETALDNSAFEARKILGRKAHDGMAFEEWSREAKAPAIPGAADFTRYAASRGVMVFFVTNRGTGLEDATRRNLELHGFPMSATLDTVWMRGEHDPSGSADKSERRRKIAATHRIVLLIGDDLNDFLPAARASQDTRRQLSLPFEGWWGRKWIILANPIYGSWEEALIPAGQSASDDILVRTKLESLDPIE